jgi:uncharacterized protein (DUF4415 family)
VKKSAFSKTSVHNIASEDTDIPEVTDEQLARGVLRVGGKPVERGKQRVTIYLDAWVVEMFKAKAGDRGYQTLINEALVQYLQQPDVQDVLRGIVREELQAALAPTPQKARKQGTGERVHHEK